jgi:hypothetical protein
MVDQNRARSNRVIAWLRQIEHLQFAWFSCMTRTR